MVVALLTTAAKHKLITLNYICSHYEKNRKRSSYYRVITIICLRWADHTHSATIAEKSLLASPSDWVQLTSLILRLSNVDTDVDKNKNIIEHSTDILRNFRPPQLREVTVVFSVSSFQRFFTKFLSPIPGSYADLDKALMALPQPTLSVSHYRPVNTPRYHSWMGMLERQFPALAKRGALKINAEYCES